MNLKYIKLFLANAATLKEILYLVMQFISLIKNAKEEKKGDDAAEPEEEKTDAEEV